MNIIQSKLTAYTNPTTHGSGDEYSVPVKGTQYSIACENLRDISHGKVELSQPYLVDKNAALCCGNNLAAARVAQLMSQGGPISHVHKVAAEGRAEYKMAEKRAVERDKFKASIFAKYGGWKKSYLADTTKWREMISEFKVNGFPEEAEKQELNLRRDVVECYGAEGERPSKFRLVDVNPHFYNCGHYPDYTVKAVESGGFDTYAEAEAEALVANAKSHRSWIQFLNG